MFWSWLWAVVMPQPPKQVKQEIAMALRQKTPEEVQALLKRYSGHYSMKFVYKFNDRTNAISILAEAIQFACAHGAVGREIVAHIVAARLKEEGIDTYDEKRIREAFSVNTSISASDMEEDFKFEIGAAENLPCVFGEEESMGIILYYAATILPGKEQTERFCNHTVW